MTSSRLTTDRARVVRWPAIALLAALVVVMIVVDTNHTGTSADADFFSSRPVVPTTGDPSSLSSTWYCAGGTIVNEGSADHSLLIANPSDMVADVALTVFSVLAPTPIEIDLDSLDDIAGDLALAPPEAVDLGSVVVATLVEPRTVVQIRVSELEGVAGEHAAVLVESNVGDMLVEHALSGATGAGVAPCASSSASSWHFAAGTTRKGARELLSVFNPFPGDAVIDLVFATETGLRAPQIYDGLVVPSGTVLPIDITGVVTLFDTVSADLTLRTGRVVVDRVLLADPAEGAGGLSVAVGSTEPAPVWVFASSSPGETVDAIVIHNPSSTDEARVDVEITLDFPDFNGTVEPVGLGIRPGRTETVVLNGDAQLVSLNTSDASGRILDGVGYWTAVRSINGLPVVAEHLTLPNGDADVSVSASPGAPIAATRHTFISLDGQGEVVLVNPAEDRIAALQLRVIAAGQEFALEPVEIQQRSRVVLDLAVLGIRANSIVIIDSNEPVFGERRVSVGTAGSVTSRTIPAAGTTSLPELPLQ